MTSLLSDHVCDRQGTISESYNSYGHTFLQTVKIRSSNNAISTSNTFGYARSTFSTTASLYVGSLIVNGDLTDGDFFISIETIEKCPATYGALFALATISLQQKLAVVDLKSLTVSSATMSATSGTVTLTAAVKVSGSLLGSVSVNVIPYAQYTGNGSDTWSLTLETFVFTTSGTTQSKNFTYDFSPDTNMPPTYPFTATLKVNITAPATVSVLPNTLMATVTVSP